VKIIDLGNGKQVEDVSDPRQVATKNVGGDVFYFSPNRRLTLRGGGSDDVWSAALLCLELFVGQGIMTFVQSHGLDWETYTNQKSILINNLLPTLKQKCMRAEKILRPLFECLWDAKDVHGICPQYLAERVLSDFAKEGLYFAT